MRVWWCEWCVCVPGMSASGTPSGREKSPLLALARSRALREGPPVQNIDATETDLENETCGETPDFESPVTRLRDVVFRSLLLVTVVVTVVASRRGGYPVLGGDSGTVTA